MTLPASKSIRDETFLEYRARIEIAIRARFAARGQTQEEADRYIAEMPSEHFMVRIRRAHQR